MVREASTAYPEPAPGPHPRAPALAAQLTVLLLSAGLLGPSVAVGGIDSQALGEVESIPSTINRVFSCGSWDDHEGRGHYRFVLADVDGGAGTETYFQRIAESIRDQRQVLRVVSTTPIREMNDDHAQYQVSRARCVGDRAVELQATFEHDEEDLVHRIRIVPARTGYRFGDVVVRPVTRRR